MDALHILPLRIIPLKTAALRQARLVKNQQLKSQIELFSGPGSGSGQVDPKYLGREFHFDEHNKSDLTIISQLAALPSYDVYSLRVALRSLGIAVDEHESLALSPEASRMLASYMRSFTRPLISAVYGSAEDGGEFSDIVRMFSAPENARARQNLAALADTLDIDITSIPTFIADYGDIYLSLSYYQSCYDRIAPTLVAFLEAVRGLKSNDLIKHDVGLMKGCTAVESKLESSAMQVSDVLDVFRLSTENMWQDIDAARFKALARMVVSYRSKIGGSLCALTLKLGEWARQFPTPEHAGPQKQAHFIAGELRQGIELIEEIGFDDNVL